MIVRSLFAALLLACTSMSGMASPDSVVVFNEIHYQPAGPAEAGEYVELFNQMGIKEDISGWRIEGLDYTFPAGSIINPGSHVLLAKTPSAGQFGPFPGNINNGGERLRLINQSGRMMDEIAFTDEAPWPVGAGGSGFTLAKINPYLDSGRPANWAASAQRGGTPGALNFLVAGSPPPVTTVPLFALNQAWRYNQSGPAFDASWAAAAHPEGGTWFTGPGALAYEASLTVPIGTTLILPGLNSPYVMTYYFETEFTISASQLAKLSSLKLKHALDDGAVIYLNGVEATRLNMPGGIITSATPASANIEAGTALSSYVPLPPGALVPGTNRLSVEVHQFASGSSDIVWGAQLDMDLKEPVPGAAPELRLNEMPAASASTWWVEIANTGTTPVDLSGTILATGSQASPEYLIPAGTLESGALLLLSEAQLGFRPADGEKVFLYSAGKTSLLDARQQTGRLRGRPQDLGDKWAYPAQATPGTPNDISLSDSIVISEIAYDPPALPALAPVPATFAKTPLLVYSDAWRYNAADENLPSGWAAQAHPTAGNWKSGPGPIGVATVALPVPLATVITPYATSTVTSYFETEFQVSAQLLATTSSLEITHLMDDGAVFFLNGVELPARFNMAATAVGPETLSSTTVTTAALNVLVVPASGLAVGSNRLSVEVHQSTTASPDIVFALKMEARQQLTPAIPGLPLRNSNNQWLELTNRSPAPVNLTGWDFAEGISFPFPPDTLLAPGESACIARDPALFAAAYPQARLLGAFTSSLSRSGESIVLRDPLRNTADEVRYYSGGQWPRFGGGGGASIELRDLDADNNIGSSWSASDESSHTAWKTYSYRGIAAASNGGPDGTWNEINLGMLNAGELWIDDLNLIELPKTAATQRIPDPGFNNAAVWHRVGNHRSSQVIPEPGNPSNNILRIVATGPTEHMHNQIETKLSANVVNGREYEIRYRARWVAGSNKLHSRLYFNRLAHVTNIDRLANPGTPSAANSRIVSNAGPTFAELKHAPAVPLANEVTTISCTAADPDKISAMALFYSVNGAAFASTSMSSSSSGRYLGSIPGQATGAVVQFYIRGTDNLGASEFYPAAGPLSRALYKVKDNAAATNGWHNFRIITTNADRDWMHLNYNTMSNDLIGCTIIDREGDIYYGAGVHLKSSERGRNQLTRVGYNLTFAPDALFRGVHESANLDRSEGQAPGQRELLFDVMISNSGGPISRYNDFIKLLAPNSALTGGAILQLARYEDTFLDEQFENGSDGNLYEYELVYYPTSADANGNKLIYPSPDGVIGLPVSNHGDDPERYRWHFLNKSHREADNFTPLINYAKTFSKTGAAFEADVANTIDVDTWFRGLGYAVLSGAQDNAAGDGSQHNAWLYARPDGRMVFLPHDMDNAYNATLSLFNNPQCAALTAKPSRRRQYLGHLHDVVTTTFNGAYMSTWTTQFAALDPSQPWASHLSYISSRASSVLSQISAAIPSAKFAITTPNPLTVAASSATLSGTGWVNVRELRIAGSAEPLNVTWTANTTWQATVPAAPGTHAVTLEAVNFSGTVIGTTSINIINTTTIQPGSAQNLVVSKIMYHPADPTPAEQTAGFTDSDQFEWIELQNISPDQVDLRGVSFTSGLQYDFASGLMLAPGARIVVARDRAAFLARYPSAATLLAPGTFLNASALSNGGENVLVSGADGAPIKNFTYSDKAPWPRDPDGFGASLVLRAPSANPDHNLPANWRPSTLLGGSPGSTDSLAFSGDPLADSDGDGIPNLIAYALGPHPLITAAPSPEGFTFVVPIVPSADATLITGEVSTSLAEWIPAELISTTATTLTFQAPEALRRTSPLFFRSKVSLR